jgi:hypothetical protein
MHQAIGKLAVIGKEQQPGTIDIQATDGDPTARRQAREDGGTPLRIAPRDELSLGLVIDEHAARRFRAQADRAAIDRDLIGGARAIAELGHATGHRDAAGFDPGFDFPPRA